MPGTMPGWRRWDAPLARAAGQHAADQPVTAGGAGLQRARAGGGEVGEGVHGPDATGARGRGTSPARMNSLTTRCGGPAGARRATAAPAGRASRVAVLALGGPEDAGAVLVGTLVGADLPGAVVVALGEHGLDLGGGQLVVARPRLVTAQRGDAAEHRGAVLVPALVGVDLG